MPAKAEIKPGTVYSRLTVIEELPRIKKISGSYTTRRFLFQCECGKRTEASIGHVTSGKTKSCGCFRNQRTSERFRRTTKKYNYHLYHVWGKMKVRCENEKNSHYKHYGAKGIRVCDEWKVFENFFDWAMENGYARGLSIERDKLHIGYCPENCRWIPHHEQGLNKTNTIKILIGGVVMTVKEYAVHLGVSYSAARYRITANNLKILPIPS